VKKLTKYKNYFYILWAISTNHISYFLHDTKQQAKQQ